MNKPTLAILCPTNKRDAAVKWLLSPASIAALKPMLEHVEIGFVIVGQGAFFENDVLTMAFALNNSGMAVEVMREDETNPCSIFHLRSVAANSVVSRYADYHLIVDDNIEFVPESADVYLDVIRYLEANPKCGSVACCGFFGSKAFGDEIRQDRQGWMVETGKGLFLRNVFEGVPFPEGTEKFVGGFEESLAIIKLNKAGYYHAKRFKVRTKHHGTAIHMPRQASDEAKARLGESVRAQDNNLHSRELTEKHAFDWIRKNVRPDYQYGQRFINLGMEFPR